jgi:hypothetical protein
VGLREAPGSVDEVTAQRLAVHQPADRYFAAMEKRRNFRLSEKWFEH